MADSRNYFVIFYSATGEEHEVGCYLFRNPIPPYLFVDGVAHLYFATTEVIAVSGANSMTIWAGNHDRDVKWTKEAIKGIIVSIDREFGEMK